MKFDENEMKLNLNERLREVREKQKKYYLYFKIPQLKLNEY